jgi:hypothetical protein
MEAPYIPFRTNTALRAIYSTIRLCAPTPTPSNDR